MASQAVGPEFRLQFLNAVFHVAPEHIDVVIDKLGVAAQVSDHKSLTGWGDSLSFFKEFLINYLGKKEPKSRLNR
jgi:hypothetical protein